MSESTVQKVSEERWRQAQESERRIWVSTEKQRGRFLKDYVWGGLSLFGLVPRYRGDDWNGWWRDRFDGYRFLPRVVHNAIEVGCGPYTNIRHVMGACEIRHLFLSDPLIKTYVGFRHTFVRKQYRQAACVLDSHPAEELPFADGTFDLTVMINVLDHVRDAAECMRQVVRVTKPGGWLVLGQDLTNEEDAEKMRRLGGEGEVMHPIKLNGEWFDQFLSGGFEPRIHSISSREQGRDPEHHYGTLVYAGVKRA